MATTTSSRRLERENGYQYDCVSLIFPAVFPVDYSGYYVDVDTSEFLSSGNGTGIAKHEPMALCSSALLWLQISSCS